MFMKVILIKSYGWLSTKGKPQFAEKQLFGGNWKSREQETGLEREQEMGMGMGICTKSCMGRDNSELLVIAFTNRTKED